MSGPPERSWDALGRQMHALAADLYPICRSLTGDGVRETLRRIAGDLPLTVHEVPTGTGAFDWRVPREWNIRDAYVKDGRGRRVVDFQRCNLHVVGYSVPVRARMRLEELKPHLHTLPAHPDWVPYRTSYYHETWGFCLAHRTLEALEDGEYEVCIDATLADGSLTYGECLLPGERPEEILFSTHVCHPSMANDNLSGIVLTATLARVLAQERRRYSYRFLFVPGTIGPLVWLSRNERRLDTIRGGLVVACVGDPGPFTYKRSRRGNAEIDRAVEHVLRHVAPGHQVVDFSPYGYDERQYGSPGFDLPVGCLTRTPHGRYPEYHTSADDLTLIRPEALAESLQVYLRVVGVLEGNGRYLNTNPKGEPQLGRRGLYPTEGGAGARDEQLALLWVLNLSDGRHSLLEIADRSGMQFDAIARAAAALRRHGLLADLQPRPGAPVESDADAPGEPCAGMQAEPIAMPGARGEGPP